MGGHKKVQAQHAARSRQSLCNRADRKARAVAGQHRVGRRMGFQLRKQALLGFQLFGDAFNHQLHVVPVHVLQGGAGQHGAGVGRLIRRVQLRRHVGNESFALGRVRVDHRHLCPTAR